MSERKKLCVIGTGRMGWAIIRQFLKVDPVGMVELYAYEPAGRREEDFEGRLHWVPSNWEDATVIERIRPDLLIHAAPFSTQPRYIELALQYRVDMVTLGQMTDFVLGLLRETDTWGRGARIVPDCGLAPGLLNILAADLIWKFEVHSVDIECGGLPLDPNKGGPLHYGLSFSPQGLIQEYQATAYYKDEGQVKRRHPLEAYGGPCIYETDDFVFHRPDILERCRLYEHPDFIHIDERNVRFCHLETAFTADGTSVMPWDPRFPGARHIAYRTIRYAGHFSWFQEAHTLNLLDTVDMARTLERLPSAVPDIVLFRVKGRRTMDDAVFGWQGAAFADPILDAFPGLEEGASPIFSAMQHLTGWPTVFAALALLDMWPNGIRQDITLFHGHRLDETLEKGGVILPYELLDGETVLKALMAQIPQLEVECLHEK